MGVYNNMQTKFNFLKTNILSGLTVALALVPEAISFAFIAGVMPLVGLWAAFIVCLITAVFGGKPGMISGATGALAVVMVSLVANHGVEYLFAAVVLMGIIQIIAGVFNLGKFVKMVPIPVMQGFVNGLAVVIFMAQLQNFQIDSSWMHGPQLILMLGLTFLTMAIIYLLPKITKAAPSALVAIVAVTVLVKVLHLDTRTIKDLASISGSLPIFNIPKIAFNLTSLKIIFPYAVIFAFIGLTESLLTVKLLNEKTSSRGSYKKECIGQGLANLVAGFFSSMGGCAMIGQSIINAESGGNSRISGIAAALFLITFVIIGAGLISTIPIAALTGVMFIVVLNTFDWKSILSLKKSQVTDTIVMLVVTVVTVIYDLAIAVTIGVILSSLIFAWQYSNKGVTIKAKIKSNGDKIYSIIGPVFFSSVSNILLAFDFNNDPDNVYIDCAKTTIFDTTALDAIKKLKHNYSRKNKTLTLINLSSDCQTLLSR